MQKSESEETEFSVGKIERAQREERNVRKERR